MKENAPTKSGSVNRRRLRQSTLARAYKEYLESDEVRALGPLSYPAFTATLYKWAVIPAKYDRFACPHCYKLSRSNQNGVTDEMKLHNSALSQVWSNYKHHIKQLESPTADFILLIIDYSRVHELDGVQLTVGGKKATLSILNWTMVLPGNKELHFDYFSTATQGEAFLFTSTQYMVNHIKQHSGNATRIQIWSDGGFKTYGTVSCMRWLSEKLPIPIYHHYLVAYHGHNRCDAHFGRGKKELRKLYPDGGLDTADQVVQVFSSLKDTTTLVFPKIVTPEAGKWRKTEPNSGVRTWAGALYYRGNISMQVLVRGYPDVFRRISEPEFDVELGATPSFKVKSQPATIHHNRATPSTPASPPSQLHPKALVPPIMRPKMPPKVRKPTSSNLTSSAPNAPSKPLVIRIPTKLLEKVDSSSTGPPSTYNFRKRRRKS